MLTVKNVSFSIDNKTILDNCFAQVFEGQKVALVGRNGSGKSTLFKLMTGQYKPESGKIEFPSNKRFVTVSQTMPCGTQTPLQFVLASDKFMSGLFAELETCTDGCRTAEIYDQLIAMDAFGAEARAASILKGLNFSDADQKRALDEFSGGYKMRVALACALFAMPDLLLLDEPTNHLDLETTLWLQNFLKKAQCAMLVVSHDREFINQIADNILHLVKGKLTMYKGNFDTFIDKFNEDQANTAAYNKKIEAKKAHMMKFVNRFRASAAKAAQAQSRLKAIAKLKEIPVLKDDPSIAFNFPKCTPTAPPSINFRKVNLGYGAKVILHDIAGSIDPDERIALLGTNGNGKTTFAKFLSGELAPLSGGVNRDKNLKIGYYRQDHFENLNGDQTAFDTISALIPEATPEAIRMQLGRFGFSGERAFQSIKTLSGGEQARLLFCQITAQKPNMLILDEPTNHLDMEMRESLIQAITEFDGAVVLITHDQTLLGHVADNLYLVANGKVAPYSGSIEDYIQSRGGGK